MDRNRCAEAHMSNDGSGRAGRAHEQRRKCARDIEVTSKEGEKKAGRQMTHGNTAGGHERDVRVPRQRGRRHEMRSGGRLGLWQDPRKAMSGQTNNGGQYGGQENTRQ